MDQQAIEHMMGLITSQWVTTPLTIVVHLGIPDLLGADPMEIGILAQKTKTRESILYRIMRALAGAGIFKETGNRQFEHTHLSACLKSSGMGPAARMFLSAWHTRAWEALAESVFNGQVPFELAHHSPAFNWFAGHPEAGKDFQLSNAGKAAVLFPPLLGAYDFSPYNSFVDIGGGYGILAMEILHHNPHMKCTIADLPEVLEKTRDQIPPELLENRCSLSPCNFFEEIPGGRDLYIMANILHNWDDEQCRIILQNCHAAMGPGTPLLLLEMLIPPGNTPSTSKFMDLEVFVMGGGKERTREQFEELVAQSGFEINRVINPGGEYAIIECIRADEK